MIKEVPNPTLECIGCIFKDALQCLSMPCFADKDNPIKYIEVNEDINENNMNKKVSEFVRKYVEEHLDKSLKYLQYGSATFLVMQSGCFQQHFQMVCTMK